MYYAYLLSVSPIFFAHGSFRFQVQPQHRPPHEARPRPVLQYQHPLPLPLPGPRGGRRRGDEDNLLQLSHGAPQSHEKHKSSTETP